MSLRRDPARFQFPALARGIMAAFATALSMAVCQAAEGWLTRYEDAMAEAEATGRPVLTVFTGSDWCPHCVTMEKNVLQTEAFRAWARDRVVLLMIDLPQQGISQEERHARSRVCIKYGVRTFPNTVLIAPDGAKIIGHSGYHGQSPETWLAALDKHVPSPALAERPTGDGQEGEVLSSLPEAVETARDSRKPMLLLVSRPGDSAAKTRVATLIEDPEFEALTRENFVVAKVSPHEGQAAAGAAAAETLLGGAELAPEAVEVIVTDDGRTPVHAESGAQSATRIVSGLRRFLANRQAAARR